MTGWLCIRFWKWWYSKIHSGNSRYTVREVLLIAAEHGLEEEVRQAMDKGLTPDEALEEWDLFPFRQN